MKEFLEIPIPTSSAFVTADDLRCYFQNLLPDFDGGFASVLDLVGDHRKSHEILEKVTIDRVSINGASIEIRYTVDLSVFNACKDQTDLFSFHRTVTGTQVNECWRFKSFVSIPERSSCDEL